MICSFSPKKHHYKKNLRDGTNLSTRTEHPVPNAVSPRRFHCIHIILILQALKKRLNSLPGRNTHLGLRKNEWGGGMLSETNIEKALYCEICSMQEVPN